MSKSSKSAAARRPQRNKTERDRIQFERAIASAFADPAKVQKILTTRRSAAAARTRV